MQVLFQFLRMDVRISGAIFLHAFEVGRSTVWPWRLPWLASLLALPAVCLQASVEVVPFTQVFRLPPIEVSQVEDGDGMRLDLADFERIEQPQSIHAEIVAVTGGTDAELAMIKPGSWVLRTSKAALASVRLYEDGVETRLGAESIVRCGGSLQTIVHELSLRARLLDTGVVDPSWTRVEANVRRDMRQWLDDWLNRMASSEDLDDSSASEILLASQVLDVLASKEGLRSILAERQLPGRHYFEVVGVDGRRTFAFDYIFRFPKVEPGARPPLLTIIHGFTTHPTLSSAMRPELESVADEMPFPFITVAPVFLGDMRLGYGWSPSSVAAFVESLAADFAADRNRLYLTGFSLGGYGTVRTVADRPDLFAAYASLCGDGDPGLGARLAAIPGYFYHGIEDGAVGVYRSLRFHDALSSAGGHPHLWIYEGVGHNVWSPVYRDPAFYERLFQERRESREIPLVSKMPDGVWQSRPYAARERQIYWVNEIAPVIEDLADRERLKRLVQNVFRDLPLSLQHGLAVFAFEDPRRGCPVTLRVGILLEGSAIPDADWRPEKVRTWGPELWLVDELSLLEIESFLAPFSAQSTSEVRPDHGETGILVVVDYVGLRNDSRIWMTRYRPVSAPADSPPE